MKTQLKYFSGLMCIIIFSSVMLFSQAYIGTENLKLASRYSYMERTYIIMGLQEEYSITDNVMVGFNVKSYSPYFQKTTFALDFVGYDVYIKVKPFNWLSIWWGHNCTHQLNISATKPIQQDWNIDFVRIIIGE